MQPSDVTNGGGHVVPAATPANPRPLVFVVDDEAVVSDLVAMHLIRRGYRVRVFHDSVLAFSAFTIESEKPKLLITDYAMRGMNGLELIRKCSDICSGLKTITISGSLSEDVLRAAAVKPDALLAKPFSFEQLDAQVEALVGRAMGA
jgi:DNA-binding response OmpR family regulator